MSPSLFNGNEEKAITATRISLSQAVNRVPSQLLLPTLTASSTPFVNHLFTACTIPVSHWFLHGYTQMTTLNQPSSADNLAFDYFLDLPFRGKKKGTAALTFTSTDRRYYFSHLWPHALPNILISSFFCIRITIKSKS